MPSRVLQRDYSPELIRIPIAVPTNATQNIKDILAKRIMILDGFVGSTGRFTPTKTNGCRRNETLAFTSLALGK